MHLKRFIKQIAINIGSNISDLRTQHDADLRTERANQALNPNTRFLISRKVTKIWNLFIAYLRVMKSAWQTTYSDQVQRLYRF